MEPCPRPTSLHDPEDGCQHPMSEHDPEDGCLYGWGFRVAPAASEVALQLGCMCMNPGARS